jgi:hypothetical protein
MIRIGCNDVPQGIAKERYYEVLDYLELAVQLHDPPKPATLRRRRRDAPASVHFGLVVNNFHVGLAAHDALLPVCGDIVNTEAEVVVFHSTAAVTPSEANRDALRRFFEECATPERIGKAHRAWEPHGLWTPETAAKVAADLGLLYVCDPLARDHFAPPPEFFASLGERAYFRLRGLGGGGRQHFASHELDVLAALCGSYQDAWVVFANPGRFQDAQALRKRIAGEES